MFLRRILLRMLFIGFREMLSFALLKEEIRAKYGTKNEKLHPALLGKQPQYTPTVIIGVFILA